VAETLRLPVASELSRAVLVVDDDSTIRRRLTQTLRANGYGTVEADDGFAALRALDSNTPVAGIVLNLVLPRMDGWAFRHRQLESARLSRIPTIIIAPRPLRHQDREVLRPADVLEIPVSDERLLTAIARACPPVNAAAGDIFWSLRGEVACAAHLPLDSTRWYAEGWCRVPDGAARRGLTYQCQYCAADHSPIRRRHRAPIQQIA
jgi:CheY-like chemotaxis protein